MTASQLPKVCSNTVDFIDIGLIPIPDGLRRRIRIAGWNPPRATLLDMGPFCTWSGKVRIRESDVLELNKHILNIIMIMVKNFIIKIITSLVKVQMLQQGVNTPLEEEAMLLPFQESPLPPPSPPEVWSWQHPAHTKWLGSLHVPGRVRAACPLASPLGF